MKAIKTINVYDKNDLVNLSYEEIKALENEVDEYSTILYKIRKYIGLMSGKE
jgi:hypothetical protein